MALNTNNITIGAGRLYIAPSGADVAAPSNLDTVAASGGRLYTAFDTDSNWRDLGFTDGGVEVGYEPTYSDVSVDQWKDAAKVFLESETMTFSTSLVEATLENLILAWGRSESSDLAVNGDVQTFSLGTGRDVACEYTFAFVVPAPGSTAVCDDSGTPVVVERLYLANRIVSVDGSTHGYRRTEATMFPVNFRALPSSNATAGQEYGIVEDYTLGSA